MQSGMMNAMGGDVMAMLSGGLSMQDLIDQRKAAHAKKAAN